jgi:galactofuranosylgalactofuranosylrhamnosyl-N-acetylglucosaminyl-diphospho-decaprenol beta-1,5/1,6-galactofuranosyltransferase
VTETTKAEQPTEEVAPVEAVLQRLVLPADADYDTLPLYAEKGEVRAGPSIDPDDPVELEGLEHVHPDLVTGRHSLTVPAGERISFATYFNAFPAGYWHRWTRVTSVVLRVEIAGTADVMVYRSNARGNQQRVDKQRIDDGGVAEFTLPLAAFGDGGWYWFDVVAGMADSEVKNAQWTASVPPYEEGSISIGITTFNRPDYCVDVLRTLAQDEGALARVDTIFVIDQGTQLVEEQAGFDEVAQQLGQRLFIVRQANLGGSGGFSRSMYEAAYGTSSRYVLLLDDDVLVEPEGILRAVAFADLCRTPTIVGGHMLDMHARSLLHTFGEKVNKYRFFWGPAPHTRYATDFATSPLRATRWLHRRIDVDYNGWWMCLIPTEAVRKIGLALPIFIKWDDAEFGLRASDAGYPTVSMPGVAVWHVSWTDKDDTIDWQAYHHARNRLLVALLHSPYPRGGQALRESLAVQFKHAVSMQYSAAELRLWALEDLLSGPEHLHRDLPTKLAEIRKYRASESDAKVATDPDAFPHPRRRKPPRRGKEPTAPKNFVGRATAASLGMVKQFRAVTPSAEKRPEVHVASMDVRWWLLSQFDSAIVSTADGAGASWYRRDPKRFMDIMKRSLVAHQQLASQWDTLAKTYRDSVGEITDPKAWAETWNRIDDV